MKLTLTLIILCIAVFLLEIFSFPLFGITTDQFFNEFGFSLENMLSKPWVLLTSIFMHGDITHLLSNIIVLFFFGATLEEEIKQHAPGFPRGVLFYRSNASET